MGEKAVLYGLLVSSLINTILLVAVGIALLRFLSAMKELVRKVESFMEVGEREVLSTIAAVRHTVNIVGSSLEKGTHLAQKYFMVSTLRRLTGNRWSAVLTGLAVGYGLVKGFRNRLD